jgi:PAS domain S-box-containing protein
MVESFLAAPLHFTLEFAGFVVSVGAALLVPSRPSLIPGRPIGRVTAAAGFLALAVAGVVHGAPFAAADTDVVLISIRTAGWVMVGLAVAGAAPAAASSAAIATGETALYAPAGGALLVAIASTLRSRTPGYGSLSRLAVAAAVAAAAESLVAVAPDAVIEDGSKSELALVAHGLRFVSFLALGSWLWTGIRTSVRARFVAAFAALLVIVVLALSTTLTAVLSEDVERAELARVRTQLNGAVEDIEEQEADLGQNVQSIAESDLIRSTMPSGADLSTSAKRLAADPGVELDFVLFLDRSGRRVVASAGEEPKLDRLTARAIERSTILAIAGSPVIHDVAGTGPGWAVNVDRLDETTIAIVAAARVSSDSAPPRPVGVAVGGQYLDLSTVEEISARVDPAAATLFVRDRVIASDLASNPALGSNATSEPGSVTARRQTVAGNQFFSAFASLEETAPGVGLALSSPAEIISDTRRDVTRGMFLAALLVGVVALVLAWLSGKRITRPIQNLTSTAQAIAGGDLSARADVSGEDEVGLLGTTFNNMTTALVRMTQEEQTLRSRIETIIQSMADGLVAVDAERRVLAFNVEAELLTGIRAEDALGRSIDDVLDVRDALGEPVRLPIHALREGAVGGVYIERRLGTPVPVAVTTAVLRNERGEATGGVAVIRDMSRERELEKLKGEFLSNISHELRTPLTPIKGYAEILTRSGVPEPKANQFARGILDSTQRLERIVGLLVDYAQIEAGRLSPRTSSVDIGSIVASLADEWDARAPRHEVRAKVITGLPRVLGDEQLLRRTLEELMDNAVKFSPEGGVIRLEARRGTNGSDGSTFVDVSVTDEGIGIPPEDLPLIFSDFHQLEGSETRTYGGLGLGLAFVQRIIQAHRGEVKVESHPDRGTRLTITIPAVDEANAEA